MQLGQQHLLCQSRDISLRHRGQNWLSQCVWGEPAHQYSFYPRYHFWKSLACVKTALSTDGPESLSPINQFKAGIHIQTWTKRITGFKEEFYKGILKFRLKRNRKREWWTRQRRNGGLSVLGTCQCKAKGLTLVFSPMPFWKEGRKGSFPYYLARFYRGQSRHTQIRHTALTQHLDMRWSQEESEEELKVLITK